MNNLFRILSALIAVFLCLGLFAACDMGAGSGNGDETLGGTEGDPVPETTVGIEDETQVFVIPPDAVGLIVSADNELITWYAYETKEDTIDFMGLNVKALGDAAAEMSLCYLEEDVSFYMIVDGKIVAAYIEDIWPGSVVGVTTLEEGVQEVYIISRPDDGSGETIEDETIEDVVDEVEATTVPADDETPEQED